MEPGGVLACKVDSYNGVIVEANKLPSDLVVFGELLQTSLTEWRKEGRRGVWLKLPIDRAHLISVAVELGFQYHHAKPDYVMMTQWLPEDTANTLPLFASHYVGVGAVVINPKNEILVVKEANGPITSLWKFPGGMVDPGEELWQAAIREVKEETGINTEFESLLCFRQNHQASFGMSDLYFIFKLRPLSFDIKKQDSEIEDCKWMPIDEFINLPSYVGVYKEILLVAQKSHTQGYKGFIGESHPVVFRPGNNTLYHGSTPLANASAKL